MADLKGKYPDAQRASICWTSIKKTHKKNSRGQWTKMSEAHEFNETLAFHPHEQVYETPSKQEVIDAINSVPSIPDKQRLISNMDERVRLIKGIKVLTEGTYNGVFYPDRVLREGADSWQENYEKTGIKHKVKLEHGKKVENRVGHLLQSYYDDGWIKQDFLLTVKKAAEQWDGGLLDDVSVRMRVGTDMENSTSEVIVLEDGEELSHGLIAKYIIGVGTDFVDNPACRTCGTNPEKTKVMEELEQELQKEDEELCGAKTSKGEALKKVYGRLSGNVPKQFIEEKRNANLSGGKCKLSSDQDFGNCLSHADILAISNKGLGTNTNYTRPVIYEAHRQGILSAEDVKAAGYNPGSIQKKPEGTGTSNNKEGVKNMTKGNSNSGNAGDGGDGKNYLTEDVAEGLFTKLLKKFGFKEKQEGSDGDGAQDDGNTGTGAANLDGNNPDGNDGDGNSTEINLDGNNTTSGDGNDGEVTMTQEALSDLIDQKLAKQKTDLTKEFEKKLDERENQAKEEKEFTKLTGDVAKYRGYLKEEFNLEELEEVPEGREKFLEKRAELRGELKQLKIRAKGTLKPGQKLPWTQGDLEDSGDDGTTELSDKGKEEELKVKKLKGKLHNLGFQEPSVLDEDEGGDD